MTATTPVEEQSAQAAPSRLRGLVSKRTRKGALPYVLLLPALVLELLIHLIPMVVGIVMSFKQLTQFFIRESRSLSVVFELILCVVRTQISRSTPWLRTSETR